MTSARAGAATFAAVISLGLAAASSAAAADWTLVTGTNSGTVSRVDAATGAGLGPGTTVGGSVKSIAISPDGTTAYAVVDSPDSVSKISLATGVVEATIPLSGQPYGIAISPDGSTAFVTELNGDAVVPIDLATDTAETPIPVGSNLAGIAITPDGRTLYVTELFNDVVVPIDVATRVVGAGIGTGNGPLQIAITPNGTTAYVTDSGATTLSAIDLASDTALAPITIGPGLFGLAISPDGATAYVTLVSGDEVAPVTLATGAVGSLIPVQGSAVVGVTFGPDGQTAYAIDDTTTGATPIDVGTGTPGTPFPVGSAPSAIAITPDQAPTASFTVAPDGLTPTFNGSASSSPVGSIASYAWNFGDGTTQTTTTPTVEHLYAAPGTYTVRLTVTNTAGTSTTQVFTGQTVSREGGPSATTAQAVNVVPSFGPGPSLFDGISALRASTHRVSLTGSLVRGRCVATTSADRDAPSCRLAIDVRLRYTLQGTATRWPVSLTIARLVPGQRIGRRCVAATAANHRHGSRCTRVERLKGAVERRVGLGTHTLTFRGVIGGHRLGPGTYRLTVSGVTGKSVLLTFVR
jgi:YVTN family beta-propeller protein